jgi:hypothetical protein
MGCAGEASMAYQDEGVGHEEHGHADHGLHRRGVLCGGGAAVFAAMVSSLIGESKAALAEAVVGPVPEVDRVAVRAVIDSYQIAVAPNASAANVEIQRFGWPLSAQPPQKALVSEFGLAMHVESQRGSEIRNVLVDFGFTPEALVNNVGLLGIDPAALDALVLSHGHYDHFGGLAGFLRQTKGSLKPKIPLPEGDRPRLRHPDALHGRALLRDREAGIAGKAATLLHGDAVRVPWRLTPREQRLMFRARSRPAMQTRQEANVQRPYKSVRELLAQRPPGVYAVDVGATVLDALRVMAERNIGAVVVLDGEALAGILSERDYARKGIIAGRAARETPVRDDDQRTRLRHARADGAAVHGADDRSPHPPSAGARKRHTHRHAFDRRPVKGNRLASRARHQGHGAGKARPVRAGNVQLLTRFRMPPSRAQPSAAVRRPTMGEPSPRYHGGSGASVEDAAQALAAVAAQGDEAIRSSAFALVR